MDARQLHVQTPSEWREKLPAATQSLCDGSIAAIVLHVYGALIADEDWVRIEQTSTTYQPNASQASRERQCRVNEWPEVLRSTELSLTARDPLTEKPATPLTITLDLSLPPDLAPSQLPGADESDRIRLLNSEPRTLARLSTLLHKTFRPLNRPLEMTLTGAECWCALEEKEKHITMPKGRSWPISRSSHMQERLEFFRAHWLNPEYEHFAGYWLEERKRLEPNAETLKGHYDRNAVRCLRLAREHWDDGYWERGADDRSRGHVDAQEV